MKKNLMWLAIALMMANSQGDRHLSISEGRSIRYIEKTVPLI